MTTVSIENAWPIMGIVDWTSPFPLNTRSTWKSSWEIAATQVWILGRQLLANKWREPVISRHQFTAFLANDKIWNFKWKFKYWKILESLKTSQYLVWLTETNHQHMILQCMVKDPCKVQDTGIPCFIVLCCIALHRCVDFFLQNEGKTLHQQKRWCLALCQYLLYWGSLKPNAHYLQGVPVYQPDLINRLWKVLSSSFRFHIATNLQVPTTCWVWCSSKKKAFIIVWIDYWNTSSFSNCIPQSTRFSSHTSTKTTYHNRVQKQIWESSCLLLSQTLKRYTKA